MPHSNSLTCASVMLAAAVVAVSAGPPEAAQQAAYAWSGPVDSLRVGQFAIELFFPELKEHRYSMLIARGQPFDRPAFTEQFLTEFDIEVAESISVLRLMSEETVNEHLLVARVEFRLDGTLEAILLKGRANRYVDFHAMHDELSQHGDWSDAQLTDAMRKKGVLFPLDDANGFLARMLPSLKKLATALGGDLDDARAELRLRTPTFNDPTKKDMDIHWHVECVVSPAIKGRPGARYEFRFEPLSAKLQSILRVNELPR